MVGTFGSGIEDAELDTSEDLTLFVDIGMGSLPFIMGALQLLPSD